jgi:dihydropteroate synthase
MWPMTAESIQFVTGRLAQHSLRQTVEQLAREMGFAHTIDVLPITVAALMTPEWIARRIALAPGTTRVLVPGYCTGDLQPIEAAVGVSVERGPRDLRELPAFFGREPLPPDYGAYDIEIIAEINHCPGLPLAEIRDTARRLAADGADVIDIGCEPGGPWNGVGDTVRALRDDGHRASIDSLDPREIEPAVKAGAELVLSVNSSNREAARDWGCEVVAVPDDPRSLAGLDETIEHLAKNGVRLRIDPVLEPIGFGFAESLGRYLQVRQRYPDAEMLMGIGNLTELTEADSAAINLLLLGFCEELAIRSVLTTQVINWARSSVRECDLARRLVYHSHRHRVLPKHLEPRLVMLRDPSVVETTVEDFERLAREIKDANYRVFAAGGEVHVVSRGLHLQDVDPLALFERLRHSGPDGALPNNLDASHSFYLGYEMCKAATALALGKQYRQDEPLYWGFLTRHESRHYLRSDPKTLPLQPGDCSDSASERLKPVRKSQADTSEAPQ